MKKLRGLLLVALLVCLPGWFSPVLLASSESALPATQVDISSTSYSNTGFSITLPSAGTYIVWADMRQAVQISASPNGAISTEFYNTTDGAAIANSERLGLVATQNNIASTGTVHVEALITVAASKTIELYARRFSGPTYTFCYLYSDADGRSRIGYVRIS
jgi:hypothetical protein